MYGDAQQSRQVFSPQRQGSNCILSDEQRIFV